MKIYTKTGDKGNTSLANGKRVSKSNDYVHLYGTSDELNSSIGICISFLNSNSNLKIALLKIQNLLFELGSELAMFRTEKSIILKEDIQFLENEIDLMQEKLEPLKQFVLPGGTKSSSFLHFSRTICRRLEREMVKARENQFEIFEDSLIFVNRLSDYLFVAARFANFEEGLTDIKWSSRAKNNL